MAGTVFGVRMGKELEKGLSMSSQGKHQDWSYGNFLGELPLRGGKNLHKWSRSGKTVCLSHKSVCISTNTAM